ncbi:LLM class flavin-dependent oxidoreductase (plasmid) [Pseudomonas silvicola]|nr:LLM class flavin-dependent oxidoreductase [Pseudomonas silvicola]
MGRSPQGRPVIFQAGASEPGRALAARTADVVFTLQSTIEGGRAFRDDIRRRAQAFGRSPDSIKIMVGLTPIIAETDQKARELADQMLALIPDDIALSNLKPLAGGVDFRQFD